MNGDFLAKIKLALEGNERVLGGLKATQSAAQKLANTKVTTIFDKQGLASGAQVEQTFKNITPAADGASKKMGDFQKALARVTVVAPVWFAFRTIMMSVFTLIRENVKFMIDLETAMARIRIVGKGTEQQYKDLQTTLISLSVAYGAVASAAVDAAMIFAQQGRNVEQIITLTRVAMVGSQVLGQDMKTTVDDLTAAVESFNIPIENSISVIDKWINVEKQFAVTSKDLANATKVAGATANQLGITINSFLGDVTSVIEVTRKTGSEAARGLSFIYARLLTTGKPVLEQIAKIPIFINKQKEATFEQTNTLRSATDVLDELASKWEGLTNKERLSIAQTVASKRQLTIFMALMQNYESSLNARIAALSSAGKAEQAFGIIQETTAIKLNKLSASWNNLTVSIGDTSAFKNVLDLSAELINRWAAIINLQQALKNESEKVIAENRKVSETQISQLQNIQELIRLRDEYTNRPATDKNVSMLNKINKAIEDLNKNSKIKIEIDSEDASENITETVNKLRTETLTKEVDIRFITRKNVLDEQIKDLKSQINFSTEDIINPAALLKIFTDTKDINKEIRNIQKEINGLDKEKNAELEKSLSAYEAEQTAIEAKRALTIQEASLAEELTSEEEERLEIQSKLNFANATGIFNSKQLLDIEMGLVQNSKFLYDQHQKGLKLRELTLQKEKTIYDQIKKQDESIKSQYINYQKADEFERSRLRRLMELQSLSPEQLASNFEGSMFDQRLITEYWSSFDKEGQDAINSVIQRLYDLPKLNLSAILGNVKSSNGSLTPTPITNTIVGAQIQQININLPEISFEELANKAGDKVTEMLKSDPAFQDLIAKGIRDKI